MKIWVLVENDFDITITVLFSCYMIKYYLQWNYFHEIEKWIKVYTKYSQCSGKGQVDHLNIVYCLKNRKEKDVFPVYTK